MRGGDTLYAWWGSLGLSRARLDDIGRAVAASSQRAGEWLDSLQFLAWHQ